MSRNKRLAVQLIPVLTVALAAGCGPFGYLKKVAKDASRSVADAEAAGAEENAPYEYWGSVTYLEQSKILMGYSEYERSFDNGERAAQLAEEAKDKAEKRKSGTMTQTEGEATADGEAAAEGEAPAEGEAAADGEAAAEGDASASAGDGEAGASLEAGASIGGGQ